MLPRVAEDDGSVGGHAGAIPPEAAQAPGSDTELAARIQAEKVDLVFANTGPALVGNILVAVLAQAIQLERAPAYMAPLWLLGLLGIAAVRWWGRRVYERDRTTLTTPLRTWRSRVLVILGLNGVWWAVFGALLVACAEPFQLGFGPFLIGGMVAAAVATLAPLRSAYLAFTLPMIVGLAGALAWRGGVDSYIMAGFAIAFEITMIGTVWRVSEVIARDIELKLQNERLVHSLRNANAELAESNDALEREVEERKRAEQHIAYLASHDSLTGLPNRRVQQDRFERIVSETHGAERQVGVLFIDLDGFKAVNDTLGHSVGDVVLKGVADRLRECVREGDAICRQGGDEFLIVLDRGVTTEALGLLAARVIKVMRAPIRAGKDEVKIGCSIGISLYPRDGASFEVLVNRADQALYRAKESGKACFRFYAPAPQRSASGAVAAAQDR